jgi:hypothetical protein
MYRYIINHAHGENGESQSYTPLKPGVRLTSLFGKYASFLQATVLERKHVKAIKHSISGLFTFPFDDGKSLVIGLRILNYVRSNYKCTYKFDKSTETIFALLGCCVLFYDIMHIDMTQQQWIQKLKLLATSQNL